MNQGPREELQGAQRRTECKENFPTDGPDGSRGALSQRVTDDLMTPSQKSDEDQRSHSVPCFGSGLHFHLLYH